MSLVNARAAFEKAITDAVIAADNTVIITYDNVNFTTICDPLTGEVIATSKEPTSIYKYNYNLTIMEERFNILRFQSGTADLLYSR